MNLNFVKFYINKIKKEDIKIFLEDNNINVNNEELDYLYDTLKNKYEDIINENEFTFKNIKKNINQESYNELLKLYNKYKILFIK